MHKVFAGIAIGLFLAACDSSTTAAQREQGPEHYYKKVNVDGVECVVWHGNSSEARFTCNWDGYNLKQEVK